VEIRDLFGLRLCSSHSESICVLDPLWEKSAKEQSMQQAQAS
jgi:hypothetical protein